MAYWSFSDVFEEQGVVRTPFYGGFGLLAADNIPKPSLNVFRALHKLGDQRFAISSDSALATKAAGGVVLALWNYAPPGTGSTYTAPSGPAGPTKTFAIHLSHVPAKASVDLYRVDPDHGNVLKAFDAMGRPPADLTQSQIDQLKAAGVMAPVEHLRLKPRQPDPHHSRTRPGCSGDLTLKPTRRQILGWLAAASAESRLPAQSN